MIQIIENSLRKSISYQEYHDLIQEYAKDKKTSGEPTDIKINFTKLNASRMRRLTKTIKLTEEELVTFSKMQKQTWLVLSESWCGDAAQTLPVMNKIAEASDKIDIKIVFRDENLDLMNHFLTNGGQAIPKVIILNDNNEVLNTWGSRSKAATKLVEDYKKEHGRLDDEFKKELQVWYNKDKGKSIIEDFKALVI